MAQQTTVRLLDDLAQSEGESVDADTTVSFALDGRSYEIDLTQENDELLREVFAPYIRAGRRQSTRGRRSTAATPTANASLIANTHSIRAWAQRQGMKVAERGRIPAVVVEAYNKAH